MCRVIARETYDFPIELWERAKSEAVRVIVREGRKGNPITYSDLAGKITSIRFDPHDHIFHLMLGEISTEEDAAARGMLTVLVVRKDDGMPGDDFWDLAKRLGRDTKDKTVLWAEETKTVLTHCKNHPLMAA
jgi:hypothetical protein